MVSRSWRRRLARVRSALGADAAPPAERPLGPAQTAALLVASLFGAALVTTWLPPTQEPTPRRAAALARVTHDGLASLVQGRAPGEDGLLQGVSVAEALLLSLLGHLGVDTSAQLTTLALAGLLAATSVAVARARGFALAGLATLMTLALPTTRGALAEGNAGALLAAAMLVLLLRAQTCASDAGLALAAAGWTVSSERVAPGLAAVLVLTLAQRAPLRRGLATAAGLALGGAATWGWALANAAFVTPTPLGWTTRHTDPAGVACVALGVVGLVVRWTRSPTALSPIHTPAAAALLVAATPMLATTLLRMAVLPGSAELGAGLLALTTVSLAPGQGAGVGTAEADSVDVTSTAVDGAIVVDRAETGDGGAAMAPPT